MRGETWSEGILELHFSDPAAPQIVELEDDRAAVEREERLAVLARLEGEIFHLEPVRRLELKILDLRDRAGKGAFDPPFRDERKPAEKDEDAGRDENERAEDEQRRRAQPETKPAAAGNFFKA